MCKGRSKIRQHSGFNFGIETILEKSDDFKCGMITALGLYLQITEGEVKPIPKREVSILKDASDLMYTNKFDKTRKFLRKFNREEIT